MHQLTQGPAEGPNAFWLSTRKPTSILKGKHFWEHVVFENSSCINCSNNRCPWYSSSQQLAASSSKMLLGAADRGAVNSDSPWAATV